MNHYLFTILFSCLIILYNPAFAQTFPHRFQTWNASNGLTSNFCNSIAMDSKGYFFTGTKGGLSRFNSYSFSPLTAGVSSSVSGEANIDDIVIDDRNRIWFASAASGLGLIDLQKIQNPGPGYFDLFASAKKEANLSDTKASRLAFDKKGYLWVGTRGNGLYRFDTLSKKMTAWPLVNHNSEYSNHIRSLTLYKPDTLFVGIVNGLSIINPLNGTTSHIAFKNFHTGKTVKPTVRKIIHWEQDTFLIATDRGAFFLHLKSGNLVEIKPRNESTQLGTINCNDVIRFTKDELWFATESDGILFYNTRSHKFSYSYELHMFGDGVPRGRISSFFRDKTGNIWIAHENGFSAYRRSFSEFLNYSHNNEYPYLSGVVISDSTNLVAMDGKHVSKFNIQDGTTARDSLKAIHGYKYPSLVMNHKEYGYVTFCNKRFYSTHPITREIKEFAVNPVNLPLDSLGHFRILSCLPTHINQKEYWLMIASVPFGYLLLMFDPLSGELKEITVPDSMHRDTTISYSKIIRDKAGDFWISSNTKGLFLSADSSLTKFSNFTTTSAKCALPSNNISDLIVDGNAVWATVYGIGLIKIQKISYDSIHYELYDKKNGLDNPFLFRMLADDYDKIWITNSNGLVCFDKKTKRFRRFSLENGIRNTTFTFNDMHNGKTSNGYAYFSDRTNMIAFMPGNIFNYPRDVQLILSQVESGRSIYNITYDNISAKFSYANNTVSFSYDVLNYENEKNIEIYYMMEGYEKEWFRATDLNKIIYRQLPSGKYKFKIRLLLVDGKFSSEQGFSFQISTPWYQAWWFISLVIAAIIALVYSLFRYRLQQKLRVLQIRNRLHRDLHDDVGATLSSVKAYSEILKDNPNNPVIAELIKDNSTEMLERLEVIAWATNPQHDHFKSLKNLMIKFATPLCHSKNIQCGLESNTINDEMLMPGEVRQNIFLVFKEAINNMIKYAEATECSTHISISNNQFVLQIADNGKGFDGTTRGSGSGWKNMQKRTQDLNGKLIIDSTPEKGTTITMSLPYPFKIPSSWDAKRNGH